MLNLGWDDHSTEGYTRAASAFSRAWHSVTAVDSFSSESNLEILFNHLGIVLPTLLFYLEQVHHG